MTFCQMVMHEILAFEKMDGHKPKLLVLCETEFREKFFAEIYEFTMKTDNVDFKTPGQFYGVPFEWKGVQGYGGGLPKWMLIGGAKP
jgi:hypothetical protein